MHRFFPPVFDKYMTISGYQLEESIERETSGELKKLFLAVGNGLSSNQYTVYKSCK